ncbi:MAG: transposase [Coriobacteriia bacterium]|nr:transposase [Coriobacteriia bacterium]
MIKEALTCSAVLGLDVGKASHWACCVTREGEVLVNRRIPNAEGDLDALLSQVPVYVVK